MTPGDAAVDRSAAVGNVPLEGTTVGSTAYDRSAYTRDNYSYDQDPDLYNLDERNHQNFRLYEERLIANKQRRKTGEVAVGKHVETETARVSVPVEKERVVIERTNSTDIGSPVAAGDADFREGEVARIDVYEEVPDIHKETVVREEVNVGRKLIGIRLRLKTNFAVKSWM